MSERLWIFHEALRGYKLKTAPDKTLFFLTAVKFLGPIFNKNKIKPLSHNNGAFQQAKRPESKTTSWNYLERHTFNGNISLICMLFLLRCIFYLTMFFFHCNGEHESVLNKVKQILPHTWELTLRKGKNLFFFIAGVCNWRRHCLDSSCW